MLKSSLLKRNHEYNVRVQLEYKKGICICGMMIILNVPVTSVWSIPQHRKRKASSRWRPLDKIKLTAWQEIAWRSSHHFEDGPSKFANLEMLNF